MKQTLITFLLFAAGLSSAAELTLTTIDLSSDAHYTHTRVSTMTDGVTPSTLLAWLEGTSGWMGTSAKGNDTTIFEEVSAGSATGSVDVEFYNRQAHGGSIIGIEVTLPSTMTETQTWTYSDANALTLSVDMAGLDGNSGNTTFGLVYQTGGNWMLKSLNGTASSWMLEDNSLQTLTIDLADASLSSANVYIFTQTAAGYGQLNKLTYSLAAKVTPSVPEPAAATLSLLALAGLAARRRRK